MAYKSMIWSMRQLAISVRDARVARGYTQEELAQKIGVSRPWISRFESGHVANAGFERIMKLFEVLDMRMEVSYEVEPQEDQRGETDSQTRVKSEDDEHHVLSANSNERTENEPPNASRQVVSAQNLHQTKNISTISDANLKGLQNITEEWARVQSVAKPPTFPATEQLADILKKFSSASALMSPSMETSRRAIQEAAKVYDSAMLGKLRQRIDAWASYSQAVTDKSLNTFAKQLAESLKIVSASSSLNPVSDAAPEMNNQEIAPKETL